MSNVNIDGTTVSSITIDGESVTEITMDGNIVWQVSNPLSMLSAPVYRWNAEDSTSSYDASTEFPETLSTADNATISSGSPTLKKDIGNKYDAIYYDGGDGHSWTGDGSVSSFPFTVLMTIYVPSSSTGQYVAFSYSNGDVVFNLRGGNKEIGFNLNGSVDPGQSSATIDYGKWQTVAWVCYSDSVEYFVNGSPTSGGGYTESYSTPDTGNGNIAETSFRSDARFDGYIYEIVMSNTDESDTNISEYHNERTS